MHTLLNDLRLSFRLLVKSPAFTLTAIAVLALGIGVNTAIFSIVHALIYSARPFPHSEQVVQLYTQNKKDPANFRLFSYPTYRDLREQSGPFAGILAHNLTMVGLGEGAESRRTFAEIISANYFDVLDVKLIRGRAFTPAEEAPGSAAQVCIVSHLYWKKTGFSAEIIGSTVRVNERLFTVVGIAPENFTGTTMLMGPEVYFPLSLSAQLSNDFQGEAKRTLELRDSYTLFLVGRLAPGVSAAAAVSALGSFATSMEETFPVEQKDQTFIIGALPRLSTSSNPTSESELTLVGTLLLSMSAIVLLIASLNLANMLLARGAARRKEFAVRLALGGGRSRIIRQLLTEGLVLSLVGGAVGLILATWSTDLLMRSLSALLPVSIFFSATANPAILAATLGFCTLSTLFFALGPALKLSRTDVITHLKEQAGEDPVPRRRWFPRNPLVVAQIALTLALLTSAGLFIRGALKAGNADLGIKADDTLLFEVDASLGGYDEAHALQIYNQVSDRLAALPGIQSASIAATVPFGLITIERSVQRAGLHPAKDAKPANAAEGLAYGANWNGIGADYFSTLSLPLLQGRSFTKAEAENKGGPAVAIIDDVLAKKLWPEGNALGQRVQYLDNNAQRASVPENNTTRIPDAPTLEVVGIVPPIRTSIFSKEVGNAIYVPFAQGYQSTVQYHLRTVANTPAAASLLEAVRKEIRHAAPGVPLFNVRTFRQHIDASPNLWIVRIGAVLFSIFGGLALMLAVIGLYGVKAYSVARRTREIGIRMALGAEPGNVQGMILREGLLMILTSIGLGLFLAFGLGQLCATMLYEVSPVDPISFILAPVVLSITAMFACYLPARKATRISPLAALRTE